MSEAYVPGEGGDEGGDDGEAEESQPGNLEVSEEGEDEGEDGDDPPARKPDWEKQAHDKAGLAAKERSKRRAVERSNAELVSRLEALESRGKTDTDDLAALIGQLRDDDDEPITDINQIKRVLKTIMTRQQTEAAAEAQRSQVAQTVRSIATNMETYEKDFSEDHPDYIEAATHYRNARITELEDLGYTGDRLMQKVASEFFTMVNDVVKSGRDPAEVVYGLAKRRGFKSGKAAADAKLQKLQQASASGAAPRARGADNGLTWDRVAKAKGAEKDRLFAKLRSQELGKG